MRTRARRDRADHICARLVARINAEAPAGLGTKEETWWAVEAPSERFMATVAAFEAGEAEEEAVIEAGVRLREAWQRAATL